MKTTIKTKPVSVFLELHKLIHFHVVFVAVHFFFFFKHTKIFTQLASTEKKVHGKWYKVFHFLNLWLKEKSHNIDPTYTLVCLRPVFLTWLVLRGETLAHEFREVFETPWRTKVYAVLKLKYVHLLKNKYRTVCARVRAVLAFISDWWRSNRKGNLIPQHDSQALIIHAPLSLRETSKDAWAAEAAPRSWSAFPVAVGEDLLLLVGKGFRPTTPTPDWFGSVNQDLN